MSNTLLHDTTGCQTGLYNRIDNRLYRVYGAQLDTALVTHAMARRRYGVLLRILFFGV